MGYDDIEGIADEFEAIPLGEKTLKQKKTVELLKAFGDDRYTDLVDELTFIEPDMIDDLEEEDDFAGPVDDMSDLTSEPKEENFVSETVDEPDQDEVLQESEESEDIPESEEERAAREDRERREEAKAILTQQILPRAVPSKPLTEEERKQAVTVHPDDEKPVRSTPRKKRKGSLFLDLTAKTEDNSETEIKSAVRQVLDESEGK